MYIKLVNTESTFVACIPVCILYKSIAGRYRPVRAADGPITACCRFIKNASWDSTIIIYKKYAVQGKRHAI